MATSIKTGGKTLKYTAEATITFEDGTIGKCPVTVTAANALSAYKAAHIETPKPPVVIVNDPLPVVRYGANINEQLKLGDLKDKRIIIESGTYQSQNININSASNVILEMTGVDLPDGSIDIGAADGLEIYGAIMRDQKYRCINFERLSNNIKIRNMIFRNIGDYAINNRNQTYWDGTDKTACKNWVFDGLTFQNTATTFQSDAAFDAKGVRNLMQNVTLINSVFKDSPDIGNSFFIGACNGYEIAYNKINNINTKNNNDNGWCKIIGSGTVHDNQISDHEGYLIRAWIMSFGGRKTVKMYNNVGFRGTKYGLLEVQVIDEMRDFINKNPKLVQFADADVYGNLIANLGTSKDWTAPVLVVYNTYGNVDFHDNTGIAVYNETQDPAKLWYGMNNPTLTPVKTSGNIYYKTASEAAAKNATLKTLLSL